METLNQVLELQRQGFSDGEIYQKLRNLGVSPREIQDSINQAKIKTAVDAKDYRAPSQSQNPEVFPNQTAQQPEDNTYQQQYSDNNNTGEAAPSQEYEQPEPTQTAEQVAQEYQENYYPPAPQAYQEQNYYSPSQAINNETISEIAEQVVSEKISEFKKEIGDISSFQSEIQDKVSDIGDRLQRIENSMDKLQQAVIGKIGEYGENNVIIQKDLENIHGTMSKLMNPLIDNYNELKKIAATNK